jgi:hypothetical protein
LRTDGDNPAIGGGVIEKVIETPGRGVAPAQVSIATVDPVATMLAAALGRAAEAGRFEVVAQLAKELEARRLAQSAIVVALSTAKRRRKE